MFIIRRHLRQTKSLTGLEMPTVCGCISFRQGIGLSCRRIHSAANLITLYTVLLVIITLIASRPRMTKITYLIRYSDVGVPPNQFDGTFDNPIPFGNENQPHNIGIGNPDRDLVCFADEWWRLTIKCGTGVGTDPCVCPVEDTGGAVSLQKSIPDYLVNVHHSSAHTMPD